MTILRPYVNLYLPTIDRLGMALTHNRTRLKLVSGGTAPTHKGCYLDVTFHQPHLNSRVPQHIASAATLMHGPPPISFRSYGELETRVMAGRRYVDCP
jgi:hypothetical protein